MHSVTLDSSGSPKKRTFSRGLSEDESLRSIIKETESSSRRLARSDSRAGTLKKRTDSQQSDQDLFMGLPEMLELQASYDEAVQELRGLEVEREALLFQVDVLQDTLEGVEELLAEAQREAGQASSELEQEKGAKRKLESLVSSLMQEVERLKEERDTNPTPPVNMTDEEAKQEQMSDHVAEEKEKDTLLCETCHRENSSGGLAAAKNGEPGAEDAGSTPTKLQRMVSQPLDQLPSLSVGDPAPKDGVFQRPYENCTVDGKDQSPDTNDSDSISAYEDASADTPEHDRIFPGEDDLPDDSENKEENPTSSCQGNEGETKNPESCIMS